jgi:hypothetical protein
LLIYLDQNALIALGRKARQKILRDKLDAIRQSESMTFVLSIWHLIETTHTSNIKNATELAEFIDSLKVLWLLERHDLLKLEVAENFYRFVGIMFPQTPRIVSFSEMYSRLLRKKNGTRFQISAADFVTQWIRNPEQLQSLKNAYEDNGRALLGLRKLKKTKQLSPQYKASADRQLLEVTAPTLTPAGIEIGREIRTDYLNQAKASSIPTLSLEGNIAEQEWQTKDASGVDRNTLIDKMHIISALPYVDEIVSDDRFFYKVYDGMLSTGFVRANLVCNEAFLHRFS